jgi:uncharacterized protein involved in exopolysaccharide biosynthesis
MTHESQSPTLRVEPEGELSLVEMASTLLRRWRMLVTIPLLVALATGAWIYSQDRMYSASASFLPQVADTRSMGGAAALAQQFGFSMGTSRSGQSPQFFVDLLQSRSVLRQAVESEYEAAGEDGTLRRATLIEWYGFHDEPHPLPGWRRAVNELRSRISTSVARETGLVSIGVGASDPLLAEQIAQRLLEILNDVNNQVLQSRAQEEGRFVALRLEEAAGELAAAETALQRFLRQNSQYRNSPELSFEYERLQRQVSMRQEVYTSLLRSQEETSIEALRDTPLFTVIDAPAGTGEMQPRGLVVKTALGFFVGMALAVFLAFVRDSAMRGSAAGDPRHREFRQLASQVWHDVRRPTRWIGRRNRPAPQGER